MYILITGMVVMGRSFWNNACQSLMYKDERVNNNNNNVSEMNCWLCLVKF